MVGPIDVVAVMVIVGTIGYLSFALATCAKKPKKRSPDRDGPGGHSHPTSLTTPTSPETVSLGTAQKPATPQNCAPNGGTGSVSPGVEPAHVEIDKLKMSKEKETKETREMTPKEKSKGVEPTQPDSTPAAVECKLGIPPPPKSMTKTTDDREEDSFETHVPVVLEAKRAAEIRAGQPVNRNRDDYKTMDHLNMPSSDFDNTMSGIKSVK